MKRILAILLLPVLILTAQEPDAEKRIQAEIETARQTLKERLDTNLSEKKTLLADIQEAKQRQVEAIATLEKQAAAREEAENQFHERMQELKRLEGLLAQVEQMLRDFNATRPEKLPLPELLPALQQELRKLEQPHQEEGPALDERGQEHPGSFAVVGPARFFRSRDGKLMGPVAMRPNSILPTVLNRVAPGERDELAKLFAGEPATPPVDVTQGCAFSLRAAQDTWLQHLAKGGPLMIPILLLGFFCLLIAMLKLWQLSRLPSRSSLELLDRLVQAALEGRTEEAGKLAQALPSTLKAMALAALANRELEEERLEALLYEATLAPQSRLERYLGLLATSASAAPLLGLLGTVSGMIHTFQLITLFGTGDARLLSGGISEALVTTEAGLVVAIPALVIHAWCTRRTRHHAALCREAALRLLKLGKPKGV